MQSSKVPPALAFVRYLLLDAHCPEALALYMVHCSKQRELTVSVSWVAVRVAMPLLQLAAEVLALT